MSQIEIQTRDGVCRAFVYRPNGHKAPDGSSAPDGKGTDADSMAAGPWHGVLVYMDGLAIRPAMLELGERLATYGYFVLLPDLFYRSGPYEPMDPHTVFSDPDKRKTLFEKFMAPATPANIMSDTEAFLDYMASQPDIEPGPIGVTGYCMGGLMSLTAAGTFPDRFACAASYHGGRLASDAPESPHLLAPKMTARVYVAGAIEDQSFPDDMKARLEKALTDSGVDHKVETYPAKHGWVFRDTPVFDDAAAERHWATLTTLLNDTLRD